jgi:hypothetical protein
MTARRLRRPVLATALVVVLTGCAGTDSPTTPAASTAAGSSTTSAADPSSAAPSAPASVAGQHIAVQVAGGQVSGDTGRVPVPVGEQVTLTVTSDVADELHLHGYDLTAALAPGTPTELTFDATIPGVFEVELHEAGTVLLSLQIG